jgi:hypothetical protein
MEKPRAELKTMAPPMGLLMEGGVLQTGLQSADAYSGENDHLFRSYSDHSVRGKTTTSSG